MVQKWAERNRNENLIAFIKSKNDIGIMPLAREIYEGVKMAKATALKYLVVLRAKGILEYVVVGTSYLWYIAQDENGNTVIPKTVFVPE